jgi:hypothetical protein
MQGRLTGVASIGRLWQTAGTAVRAVTRLHAMAVTMATRSISLRQNLRIRMKCESLIPASALHFTHYLVLPRAAAVLCIFCDDNVNIRIHRCSGSRMRLYLVHECTRLRLSCTWPSARPNSAIVADVTGTGPLAPLAAAPRAGFSSYDHRVTTAAGVEGCQHVREAWPTRFAGRR